tara:strand:+ start:1694 stop:2215 length:522 start_codon:yes stop_codon:yes gene_type:complete
MLHGHAVMKAHGIGAGGISIGSLRRIGQRFALECLDGYELVGFCLDGLAIATGKADANTQRPVPFEWLAHWLAHADAVGTVGCGDVAFAYRLLQAMGPSTRLKAVGVDRYAFTGVGDALVAVWKVHGPLLSYGFPQDAKRISRAFGLDGHPAAHRARGKRATRERKRMERAAR